jgi:hypothetical protein
MRLLPNLDLIHTAIACIKSVDHIIKPSGQPEPFPVIAHVPHIRTAAAWNGPMDDGLVAGKVDDGDTPRALLFAMNGM